MKMSSSSITRISVAVALLSGASAVVNAAVLKVPSAEYANLYDAVPAAQNGDEIRVANDYTETLAWVIVENKSITIRSYTPDFLTPAAGAKWDTVVLGGEDDALLTLNNNASVTIDGLYLSTPDGNAVFMNSGSSLVMNDCETSGVGRSNTAGIKAPSNAQDISVNITNSNLHHNGRAIWLNGVAGTTTMNITGSEFIENSSFPIEWRLKGGTHSFNMTDSTCVVTNNRQIRTLAYDTAAASLISAHAVFDRCYFEDRPTGRSIIKVGGVPDAADANSTMTLAVTNSVFDLTKGFDDLETVAMDTQDDIATRRFAANFTHCTIAFGGANQCGFRLREHKSVLNVQNCIVDANGEGRIALRGWRGAIISRKNLINAATISQTATGGSVVLSGNEIVGESADFVDPNGGNFRPTAESPVLNAGENLGVTVDILGNVRPSPEGTNPDLGAYEFVAAARVNDWAIY